MNINKELDKLSQEKIQELTENLIEKVKGFHKIPHQEISSFFTDTAPKLKSIEDVQHALTKLYSKHGMEISKQKISAIINAYKKKVNINNREQKQIKEEFRDTFPLDEKKLSQMELDKREEIVKSIKKSHKADMMKRYGDDWKNVAYAIATKQAKLSEEDIKDMHWDKRDDTKEYLKNAPMKKQKYGSDAWKDVEDEENEKENKVRISRRDTSMEPMD